MATSPLVSVIIPSHDRLTMLKEAVASVWAQTHAPLELWVVDDASADGTWAWLQGEDRIRSLRHACQRGPSAARNTGAAAARGRYLAFLDSDDLFLPTKLERQVELLESEPDLPMCHANEIWRRNGEELRQGPQHLKLGGSIFEHCLPMCRISPSAAVIRRHTFEELCGFDEELEVAEDYELWLRITSAYKIGFVEEPLIIKRGGHPDQLSCKYGQIEKFRIEALRRILERTPLSPAQRQAAQKELHRKCEIHARGCEKRGKPQEAARYRALTEPWAARILGPLS